MGGVRCSAGSAAAGTDFPVATGAAAFASRGAAAAAAFASCGAEAAPEAPGAPLPQAARRSTAASADARRAELRIIRRDPGIAFVGRPQIIGTGPVSFKERP